MPAFLSQPWPWYIAGPLIGLMVPALLLIGGKEFGVSVNLRHMCAALAPGTIEFFRYDWRRSGLWNLVFLLGVVIGGILAAPAGRDFLPEEIFSWHGLLTPQGFIMIVVGGFLVGFGARWAGGCTSGHGIAGLASLQLPSLLAVLGFFAGGLLATHLLMPGLLR